MRLIEEVRNLVARTLSLGERLGSLDAGAPLVGSIPELDSIGVVAVVTAMEERYGITIDDEELDGQVFASLSSLAAFLRTKLN